MKSETITRNQSALGMVLGASTTLLMTSVLLAFDFELFAIGLWWGIAVAMHVFLAVVLINALTQKLHVLLRAAAVVFGLAIYTLLYYLSIRLYKYLGGPIGLVSVPLLIAALSIRAYPRLTVFRKCMSIGLFTYLLLSIFARNFTVYLMHNPTLILPIPLINYLNIALGILKLMFVAAVGLAIGAWAGGKLHVGSYSPGKIVAIAVILVPMSVAVPYGAKAFYMHNLYDRMVESGEIPEYPDGKITEMQVHVINPTLSHSRFMGRRIYVHTYPDLVYSVEITGADEDTVRKYYDEELRKRGWRYDGRGDIYQQRGFLFSPFTGRSKFIRLETSARGDTVRIKVEYSRFNQ